MKMLCEMTDHTLVLQTQGAIPAANAAALMGDTAASARASRSLPNVPAGFNWLALGQGLAPPEQLLSLQEVRSIRWRCFFPSIVIISIKASVAQALSGFVPRPL